MKVLVLEPYFAGSHKYFHQTLCQALDELGHEVFEIKMKARHWRWRMQGAHLFAAPEIDKLINNNEIDLIWTNSLIDVCSLKGLLKKNIPAITYFHEHQMSYPIGEEKGKSQEILKDHVFPGIHLSQYLSSHLTLFSSEFNRRSFFSGIEAFIKSRPEKIDLSIYHKKNELCPVPLIGNFETTSRFEDRPRRILWNHRWEYDKNPKSFSSLAFKLLERGIEFELELLGEYKKGVFEDLEGDSRIKISSLGGPEPREAYLKRLAYCKILPVTSHHDFFGISVREAILSGVIPILPERMAYPECIPKDLHNVLLYKTFEELEEKCIYILDHGLNSDQYETLINFHRGNDMPQFKINLSTFFKLLNSQV